MLAFDDPTVLPPIEQPEDQYDTDATFSRDRAADILWCCRLERKLSRDNLRRCQTALESFWRAFKLMGKSQEGKGGFYFFRDKAARLVDYYTRSIQATNAEIEFVRERIMS